jgi:hypothetical protein
MVSPFGSQNIKGLIDFTLFWQGALINNNCPVQPESTIAVFVMLKKWWGTTVFKLFTII